MKSKLLMAAIPFAVLISVLYVVKKGKAVTTGPESHAADRVSQGTQPIIVELFTSEGCSSCPPADVLLDRLQRTQPVNGANIIALEEHVDYWNHLGWADPYSSHQFSERQSAYARAFGIDGDYTPQMVVDGATEFVGSDSSKAISAVGEAAKQQKAELTLTQVASGQASGGKSVALKVEARQIPAAPVDVYLALTEDALKSSVSRGENEGRTLRHTSVVRSLVKLGRIKSGDESFSTQTTININPSWKRDNLRVVAFIQINGMRGIVGAAMRSLAAE